MAAMTIEEALADIPLGWSLSLVQCEKDWSASLVHGGLAWNVGGRGGTAVEAILAVSSRVKDGRLMPEGDIAMARRR